MLPRRPRRGGGDVRGHDRLAGRPPTARVISENGPHGRADAAGLRAALAGRRRAPAGGPALAAGIVQECRAHRRVGQGRGAVGWPAALVRTCRGTVTLLPATKDAEHSQAAVLAEQLAKGTAADA